MRDSEELLADARERVLESFHSLTGHGSSDWSFIKDKIKHTLSEFLYVEELSRYPMILPVVMEV